MTDARFLKRLVLILVLGVAAIAGFNFAVDPYDYWGIPRTAGVNAYKPEAGRQLLAAKMAQAGRLQPRTVLAGNSRIHVGLSAASPVWPDDWRPVYNLGLPGESLAGSIQAARAVEGPVGRVILAVDFLDFRAGTNTRPASIGPTTRHHMTPQLAGEMLLSLDAFGDSAATVLAQRSEFAGDMSPLGDLGDGDYRRLIATEGHRALFDQRERENLRNYVDASRAYAPGGPRMAELRDFLALSQRPEVILVTHPYHADLLVAFEAAGLWPQFEAWKRELTGTAADAGVPLYDFARIDSRTSERPPTIIGDTRTRLAFYWEGGHYKRAMGERMIAEIVSGDDAHRLNGGNVTEVLQAERAALGSYKSENPQSVARIVRTAERLRAGAL